MPNVGRLKETVVALRRGAGVAARTNVSPSQLLTERSWER